MRFFVCVSVCTHTHIYNIYILRRLYHNKHSEVCQKDTENSPLSKMDRSSRLKSSKDMAEPNTHQSTRYN